jgi:uncharacterized protein
VKFRDDFPLPDVDWEPTRPFWAAAADGVLAFPRCEDCLRFVWYPEPACRWCRGPRLEWTPVSGRARLFSWSVVRRAFIPQFQSLVPFVSGLVAIDEDAAVRLVTRIVDCDPEQLRVDEPLRVVFRALEFPGLEGRVTAPMFIPA